VKQLPRLWRRTNADGAEIGAWHVTVKKRRINLLTDDRPLAHERRREAVRGVRKWPRKMLPKNAAPAPTKGTADSNLAALGEMDAPDLNPGSESSPAAVNGTPSMAGHPAPPPDLGEQAPVIEPEPIPAAPADAGDWAADMHSAGSASAAPEAPAAPQRLRLQDFEWFDSVLVTASKIAVGLQLKGQAYAMRVLGDVEAGRVGPPPVAVEGEGVAAMAAFMKIASARWEENDPREPGRRAYEKTIVALIPAELPVPAWLKWFEAPLITAVNTAPIQWETGRKIKPGEAPAEPEQQPQQEAPPGERAAA
jgi:hypothetical protein